MSNIWKYYSQHISKHGPLPNNLDVDWMESRTKETLVKWLKADGVHSSLTYTKFELMQMIVDGWDGVIILTPLTKLNGPTTNLGKDG